MNPLKLALFNNTASDEMILVYCLRLTFQLLEARIDRSGNKPTWEQSAMLSRILSLVNMLDKGGTGVAQDEVEVKE